MAFFDNGETIAQVADDVKYAAETHRDLARVVARIKHAEAKAAKDGSDGVAAMPGYLMNAQQANEQESVYGPPPTAAQYGGACALGATTGLVISAFGPGELTLGVGSAVGAGIGCGIGMLIVWGTYTDENLAAVLHELDLGEDIREALNGVSELTGD